MARKRDKLKSLTTSWAGRTLATGRMAASLGKAAADKVVRNRDAGEGLGADLLADLDAMKGLAMKVGQMVSYLDGSLPPETQRVLRKLQQGGQPVAFEALEPVLVEALGAPVAERFDHVDPEPVAAASIGQVHRGVVDGHDVAIKIQYPGVQQTFAIDLGTFGRIGRLASLGTALDVPELVAELRERLDEECDYEREARAQRLFRTLYADDPRTIVPEVIASHCGPSVLTSSWEEGEDFYAFVERASEVERREVAERVFRFAFRNIFHHGVLHGDPHPGNLRIRDEGVVFLDYGCVRFFEPGHVEAWKKLAWCTLEGRRADLPEATRATGFVPDPDRYDWDAHWEVMQYLYEPFTQPQFTYSHDYVRRSYDLMSMNNPNWRRTAMPRAWLLTNRLQWGLNSILAILGVEADFATMYRECLSMDYVPAQLPEHL